MCRIMFAGFCFLHHDICCGNKSSRKKPWKVIRSDVYDEFWRYFLMMPWMSDPQECWRWTKDVVDNRTLAETLGEHGKIVAMVKMFFKALKLRLLYEIGAKR